MKSPPTEHHETAWKRFMHRRGLSKGDIAITVGGLGLAFACAAFPWYVFYNQEQFGVREMRFSGNMTPGHIGTTDAPIPFAATPMTPDDFPIMELDLFTTASAVVDAPRPVIVDQPFPEPATVPYRIVHIANGRAMIEDEGGYFVVQPGSTLPDATRASSIEQRDGKWVLVNSDGLVVPAQ
ncbi:hypothetical protein [Aliihoeflea sp. PC F10.4]